MTDSDIFDEFEKLWESYRAHSEAAHKLTTPNSEDDEFIRMAIIGFTIHQTIDKWRPDHRVLAIDYLDSMNQPEDTSKMKKFTMLAFGTVLGLYSSWKIDERGYRIGNILIPGFVMSKGASINTL